MGIGPPRIGDEGTGACFGERQIPAQTHRSTLGVARRLSASAKQLELRPAQRLGLGQTLALAQVVETLHQLPGASVGHRPQRRQHALGALLLRQRAEALDLAPVRARPAGGMDVAA